MVTLVSADEPLYIVPVVGQLTTAPAASGTVDDGYAHAATARSVAFPNGATSVSRVSNPSCGCLSGAYIEMDVQVPHLTTPLTHLVLKDSNGVTVLDVDVPPEQQTRFTLDGDTLSNRVRIELDQSSAPSGSLDRVASLSVSRAGLGTLDNIDPKDRPFVYWIVSSVRVRFGCKECGAVPGDFRRENAFVPLSATPSDATTLMSSSTLISDAAKGLDLSMAVDPGCRCISPSLKPESNPTIALDVKLRHRNVWPHTLSLRSRSTGATVFSAVLPRADPNTIGSWQRVTLPVAGPHSVWKVGPGSRGGHGTLPPWHDLEAWVSRASLAGTPSASEVPDVRGVVFTAGAPSPADAYVVYLRRAEARLVAQAGDTQLQYQLPNDGGMQPDVALDWGDVTAFIDASTRSAIASNACEGTCGGLHLSVTLTVSSGTLAATLTSVALVDAGGATLSVSIPAEEVARAAAVPTGDSISLWLPLVPTATSSSSASFQWGSVAAVTLAAASAPASASAAEELGAVVLGDVRVGRPQRVGHVSNPDDYNTDDLACDPMTGWFDMGYFTRHDPVRYSHCRECCCYFDDPGNPVVKHCYDQGDIIAQVTPAEDMAPNDQCAVCNRNQNPQVMTPRNTLLPDGADPPYALCDDAEGCTYNDRCRDDGACIADLYTTCLVADFHGGDPSKDCEECDGTGPDSATLGCRAKEGFFVFNATSPTRSCGCRIDGVVYPHMQLHPLAPCLRCDVTQSNTEWSEVPNDSKCDITQQFDWLNVASQACSFKHICSDGYCAGRPYSCPPIQACEAALDEFPHVCDLSGPASETGGCQRRKLPEGVMCAPQVHGCMPAAVCTGIVGTCPPQISLAGIIYEDVGKGLRLRLPDGTDADPQFAVLPSLDDVRVAYDSFRVECGSLQLRMGIIPNGECNVARVSRAVGNGWGDSMSPPVRGSFAVLSQRVELDYQPTDNRLVAADASTAAVSPEDPALLALDAGVSVIAPAAKDADFRFAGVAEPFLDMEVMRHHGAQIQAVLLVDGMNRTVEFTLPVVRTPGVWVPVTGPGLEDTNTGFDWEDVVGLRVIRAGESTLPGVAPGAHMASIRHLRIRTRAQGPPCLFAHIADSSGADTDFVAPEVAPATFRLQLNASVDVSPLFDVARGEFVSDTLLSLEVLSPLSGFVPTEVALLNVDGEGLVVGVVSGDTTSTGDHRQWTRVLVAVRPGVLTSGATATTFQDISTVQVRFDKAMTASGAGDAAAATHNARVRRVHLVRGAFCAHAYESRVNGMLDIFAATSATPVLRMDAVDGTESLRYTFGSSTDVGGYFLDLDLSSLDFDDACMCFPGAVLEVDVTPSTPFGALAALHLVEAATGHGLRVAFDQPGAEVSHVGGQRQVLRVALDSAAATVTGPPSAWANVNTLRMWHNMPGDEAASVGSFVVHAMRVRRTSVACVTTTTLLDSAFETPSGAVMSTERETVLTVGDEATGRLVRVPGALLGVDFNGTQTREASHMASRHAGAFLTDAAHVWHAAAIAVDSAADARATLLAATVGTVGTVDADSVGVAGLYDARAGRPLWHSRLGTGVAPLASAVVGDTVFVVGAARRNGSNVHVSSLTATATGDTDAFVAGLDRLTGAGVSLATAGAAGSDAAWTCVAVAASYVTAAHPFASHIVLGGSATGRPAGMGVAAEAAPNATRVGVVTVFRDAAAVRALTSDPTGTAWQAVLGDADAGATVEVSVDAVLATASYVVAAGTYSGGPLTLDDGHVKLPASSSPDGTPRAYVAVFSHASGALVWAAALPADATALGGPQALATRAGVLFVTATAGPAHMGGRVRAVNMSTGEVVWDTAVHNASCAAVTVLTDPSGPSVMAVGTTAADLGAAGVLLESSFAGATTRRSVHPAAGATNNLGLVLRLDADTGRWLESEVVSSVHAPGATPHAVSFLSVAGDPVSGYADAVCTGTTAGGLAFGVHPVVAAYPADTPGEPRAVVFRLRASHRAIATSLLPLYRDAGAHHQVLPHLAASSFTFAVAGALATTDGTPLGGASGATLGSQFVSASETATMAAAVSVVDTTTFAATSQIVGSLFGADGGSAFSAVQVASQSLAVAVGYVDGASSGFLSIPGASSSVPVAHPDSMEPLMVGLSLDTAEVLWIVPPARIGSTRGDDVLVDASVDVRSRTLVAIGATDAAEAFTCEDWHLFEDPAAFAGCTTGFVSVVDLPMEDTEAPSAVWTSYIGGNGLSSTLTSVRVSNAVIVLAGTFEQASGPQAPPHARGPLVLPATLRRGSYMVGKPFRAGHGMTLEAPEWGHASSFVAVYDAATGTLLRATVLQTTPLAGMNTGIDALPFLSLDAIAVDQGSIALCGHTNGAGVLAAAGVPVEGSLAMRAPTLGGDAEFVLHARPEQADEGAELHPRAAFVATLDATGAVSWVTWATTPTEDGSGVASSAVAFLPSSELVWSAALGNQTRGVTVGALHMDLTRAAGVDMTAVLAHLSSRGVPITATALGATQLTSSVAEAAEEVGVEVSSMAVDVSTAVVMLAVTTNGGHVVQLNHDASHATPLAGIGAMPSDVSAGSWDSLLVAWSPAVAAGGLATVDADAMAWVAGVGVHSAWGNLDAPAGDVALDDPTDDPTSLGFATGASVGARHALSVGFFKGTLQLDAEGTVVTSAGNDAGATTGFDALAMVYRVAGVAGSRAWSMEPPLTLSGLEGGPAIDDRFRGAASSVDGGLHVIVGHASVTTPFTPISLGVGSAVLPGGGGRDGFLALLDDSDLRVHWMATPGAVGSGDDVLLDAAMMATSVVLCGGHVSGAIPTFASTAVFDADIESRTLATVYALGVDGTEKWGRAFGTEGSAGVAVTQHVAVSPTLDATVVVIAGYFANGGNLQLDSITLAPTPGALRTAFVAGVDSVSRTVLWARTPVASAAVGPTAFSVMRGLAVSESSVVLGGEFSFPTPAENNDDAEGGDVVALQFLASPLFVSETASAPGVLEARPASAATNTSHAFVAVLDAATGNATHMVVPQCPGGCRAGGVATAAGRAFVGITYAGSIELPGVGQRADLAAPAMHRTGLLVVSGNGAKVDAWQALGQDGGSHVDAGAVAVSADGAAAAVVGWRSGGVGLLNSDPLRASAAIVEPVSNARWGALVEFQPFATFFDGAARSPPPPSPAATHASFRLVTGMLHDDATSLLDAVAEGQQAGGVACALSAGALVTGWTASKATFSLSSLGDDGLAAGRVVAGSTAGVGVVSVTDRRSGAELFSMRVSDNAPAGVAAAATIASSGDGTGVCLSGWVDASSGDSGARVFGTDVSGLSAGGTSDAWLACFPGVETVPEGSITPSFVHMLSGAGRDAAAPSALAVTDGVTWMGLTFTAPLPFGSGTLPHDNPSASPPVPKCGLVGLDTIAGAELVGRSFGSTEAGNACGLTALVASRDGRSVFVAGWFTGATLELSGSLSLNAVDGGASGKATAFVAGFAASNLGGGSPQLQAFFASVPVANGTHVPLSATPIQISGLALAEDGEDGVVTRGQRLYVTGVTHAEALVWQGDTSLSSPNPAVALAPPADDATADASAAFVAAFDVHAAPQTFGQVPALWTRTLASAARDGIVATARPAFGHAGRVVVAMTATAPVRVTRSGTAVGPMASLQQTLGAAEDATQFVVVAELHGATGASAAGYALSSDRGSAAAGELLMIAGVCMASPPSGAAGSAATPADDVVVVGLAQGTVRSSQQLRARDVVSQSPPGGFMLFAAGLGAGVATPATSASVFNADASAIESLDDRFVVQFELWRSSGAAVVAGGELRQANGAGTGVRFMLSAEMQAAQAQAPGKWVLLDAPVSRVTSALDRSAFGASGGETLLSQLRSMSLFLAPAAVDDAAQWRLRNVKLVPRVAECVPCGVVPVQPSVVTLQRAAVAAADVQRMAGARVVMATTDRALPALPVDATTLVDPTCDCLRDAWLQWQQRVVAGEPAVPVAGARITNLDGVAGLFSTRVEYGEASGDETDVNGFVWRTARVHFHVEDHVRTHDVDWRALSVVELETVVPHATNASGDVPGAVTWVKDMQLGRDCLRTTVMLHTNPLLVNSSMEFERGDLGLQRGNSYRVITYETNMWGDDSAPTCSRDFVVDDTAPVVSTATVIDVLPEIGAAEEDIAYTQHRVLKVGWEGHFEEPDSAPANLLLFRIVNVTAGSPDGGQVEFNTEEKVLATTSTGHVSTLGEMELEDGEIYFAHLGVCNRGKLCSTIVSSHGVVHDSSPPTSDRLAIASAINVAHDTSGRVTAWYQRDDQNVTVEWSVFEDPHTWVDSLRVGLGTAQFGTDVHEFSLLANESSSFWFGPKDGTAHLLHGQPYFAVFAATNPAHAREFYRTAPLYIDTTPPEAHWVVDVFPMEMPGQIETYFEVDENTGDVDLTDSSRVRAKFHCDDPESVENGLRGNMTYRWRVCSTPTCDTVNGTVYADWEDTDTTPRGASNTSILTAARDAGTLDWVYVQVECTNPVGLSTLLSSDGVQFDPMPASNASAVVADLDPRSPASDPDTADVDWLPTPTLGLAWKGFTTELGRPPLMTYQVGWGSAPGLDDVWAFESVGLATTASLVNVTLAQGETYYATVRAVTTAGSISEVYSDGVTMDFTPPAPAVRDVPLSQLALTDARRCAPHLLCMEVAPTNATDIDFIASTAGFGVLIPDIGEDVTPLVELSYGVSTCDALLDLNALPATYLDVTDRRLMTDDVQLFHAQRYCGVVFELAAGGLFGYNASDGVVVDITPPVVGVVHEGLSDEVDDDAITTPHNLTVTYSCKDEESGVHHAETRVTHVNFASGDVLAVMQDWTLVPDSWRAPSPVLESHTVSLQGDTFTTLVPGEWYVTTVRCVNGAGAYVDMDSDGVQLDVTAPDTDEAVIRHTAHAVHVDVQAVGDTLHASWAGFRDPESPVVAFAWAVGTAPHTTDVLPVTHVGAATSAHAALALTDGTTYFVTVYAYNRAGLVSASSSGGVTVDTSAPAPVTSVALQLDHPDALAGWIASADTLTATWDASSESHTAVSYRWAIGTVPGGQQVLPWTFVGEYTNATAHGLGLLTGQAYYVSVETTNAAGLSSVASNVVRSDPHPPLPGMVVHGTSVASAYVVQTSATTLECAWEGFSDATSGLAEYRVGFGTTPATTDTATAEAPLPPSASSWAASDLTLEAGTTYHCLVTAFDRVGHRVTVASAGVVPDWTAPVAGEVRDADPDGPTPGSATPDVDFQVSTTAVSATWPGWTDPETGIARVEWAVGTSAGATDVVKWTHVGSHRTAATAPASLAPYATYYASVRAYNKLGAVTTASSDGVTVLAQASDDVPVTVALNHIPAWPMARDGQTGGGAWCGCGGPGMGMPDAVFDPATGACSCTHDTFLDDATNVCTPCPTGTCKPQIGNANTCSAAACSASAQTPATPVNMSGVATCGDAAHGTFTRPSDGACVCPPGTWRAASGVCVACAPGLVQPEFGNAAQCRACWSSWAPDVVLAVSWDMAGLSTGDVVPDRVVVSVGTSPGALRWVRTVPGNATSVAFHSRETPTDAEANLSGGGVVPFRHGAVLYVRVRAVSGGEGGDGGAGGTVGGGVVLSDTRVVTPVLDLSPPIRGEVLDLTEPGMLYDVDTVARADRAFVSWHSFGDTETEVEHYRVRVVEVQVAEDGQLEEQVVPGGEWRTLPAGANETTFTLSPPVADGTRLRGEVQAFSPSGAWTQAVSNGVVVQAQAPVGVAVMLPAATVTAHRAGAHVWAQQDDDALGVAWAFDTVSPLTYVWQAFDVDTGAAVTNATAVGDQTWGIALLDAAAMPAAVAPLNVPHGVAVLLHRLEQGHRYHVRVTATNPRGLTATATSPPLLIDPTPPVATRVNVSRGGPSPPGVDHASTLADVGVVFQSATDAVVVSWNCRDAEATVVNVTVAVGGTRGGDLAMAARTVRFDASAHEFTGLHMVHGHCYVAQLSCTTEASLHSSYLTSAPVCVDATPPAASVQLQAPLDAVAANSSDASAVNATHATLVVSAAARDDPRGVRDSHVPVAAQHLLALLSGGFAASANNASQPVFAPAALDAPATLAVVAMDPDSGMTHMELEWVAGASDGNGGEAVVLGGSATTVDTAAVGLLGSGLTSAGWTFSGLAAALGAAGLPVSTPLTPTLWVTNGAGDVTGTQPSFPLVLDVSAPEGEVHVAQWSRDTATISASWSFHDAESGVLGVVWSVTDDTASAAAAAAPDSPPVVIVAPAWLGSAHDAQATGLSLEHGHVYVVHVTVCNHAGVCATESARTTIDTTAPNTGVAFLAAGDDGGDGGTLHVLPAGGLAAAGNVSWTGFGDGESPVEAYSVALGTVAGVAGDHLGSAVHLDGGTTTIPLAWLSSLSDAQMEELLYHGAVLHVTVACTNGAGLTSAVVTPLLGVDIRSPHLGVLSFDAPLVTLPVEAWEVAADAGADANDANDANDADTALAGGIGAPAFVRRHDSESVTVQWAHAWVGEAEWEPNAVVSMSVQLLNQSGAVVAEASSPLVNVSASSFTWSDLGDLPDGRYTASVTAQDGAGNTVTSITTRALVVDTTPPVRSSSQAFHLRDGLGGVDEDCVARTGVLMLADDVTVFTVNVSDVAGGATSVVGVTLDPFHDPESGVARVQVSLGTQPGAADVLDWTEVPKRALRVQMVLPEALAEGTVVFSSVRATNGAGLAGVANSDGLRLLCEPGEAGCVYDGWFQCL